MLTILDMEFDREKYILIAKSEGPAAAITALHQDTELLEQETFEGREGYRPELLPVLEEVRNFSRQLWEYSINPKIFE